LADEFPNWNVELWGAEDGKAYYKELQLLIKKHHLENRVFLKGPTNDVPSVLQQGDIFAFPSAYEGFGLALGEAMSMGLPAVGYKSCSAVNELIKDGENGYLCDDGIEPLRISMKRLMSNLSIRVSLGERARADMKQYSSEVIWDTWEILISQL
ncbi:MAG: glycosyltransferase, partial [Bacillota bacterium]